MGLGTTGRRRRDRSLSAATAWVLIAGFLLQPVLTYLATPLAAHDRNDQWVMICTLQGTKLVTLELPPAADADTQTELCSVLQLLQMVGSAQISEPPQLAPVSLYALAPLVEAAARTRRALHFSAYSTRAPPSIS